MIDINQNGNNYRETFIYPSFPLFSVKACQSPSKPVKIRQTGPDENDSAACGGTYFSITHLHMSHIYCVTDKPAGRQADTDRQTDRQRPADTHTTHTHVQAEPAELHLFYKYYTCIHTCIHCLQVIHAK